MQKTKRDIDQQNFKIIDLHLSNLNNFHSLEVVDRGSETQLENEPIYKTIKYKVVSRWRDPQLQVGKNSN